MNQIFSMKSTLMAMVIGLVFVTACKKEEDTPVVTQPTKKELLVDKNWKLTALTVSPALSGVTDLFATFSACDKDDFNKFQANGVYIIDEGATKCDSLNPQTKTGTWSLSSDEKIITTIVSSDTTNTTIINLDANNLKGTLTIDFGDGVNRTVTATYVKQ